LVGLYDSVERYTRRAVYTVTQKDLCVSVHNSGKYSQIFKFFTVKFGNKFATKCILHCPPHLKRVAALARELRIVNFVILQAQ